MKKFLALAIFTFAAVIGCGTSSTPNPAAAARGYSGTASVGDFLSITVDATAHTITYTNHSNGDTGTVPYTENANGTYTINDPTGNFVSAYELPNYGLLIEATKTGPNHNTPALITAIQKATISLATFSANQYNYIQFRTAAGGMEVGSVSINAQGDISNSSYWPYGGLGLGQSPNPFNSGTFPGTSLTADPSGNFLKLADDGGSGFDYIFGTQSGLFAVDTPNGAILGFKKAATKDFDPAFAGTYKAVYYEKTGAATGVGNVETGTADIGHVSIAVDAVGHVTISDLQGAIVLQATLTPVADTAYLYDGTANELHDPCFGLFTMRIVHGPGDSQDIFVTFVDRAMLFSSFATVSRTGSGYEYMYGVGLK
jgi:hypothetical protein